MYENAFSEFLDPNETVIWSGQPKQGLRLQSSDLFTIPFSLMWCGFAFFWEASVIGLTNFGSHGQPVHGGAGLFMSLWGIPFCCVGIYMVAGRFFFDAFQRKNTAYIITNRRALIKKSGFSSSLQSFDFPINPVNLVERSDRSGDIAFGTPVVTSGRSQRVVTPGFYMIMDARMVFDRLRGAQGSK